ncbi:hypothetical protein [Alteromonas sp. a30]|uniref:hypothetical protein n=1 Tax=Alteromonas sp. a30 TaxID=2730917 RepID=UPI00227E60C3|nr:hypothetical protein [Alteromonas sp. a30]MCY7293830.1 hypothetical protein [Alteromonas sp. a30]
MFGKKLKVEKVELVKKIIRQYNYTDFEKAHQECVGLGIKVNRPALDNFALKLKQLDTAEKPKLDLSPPPIHQTRGSLVDYFDNVREGIATFSHIEVDSMTAEQASERKNAITLELGELKIKEHALLQELSLILNKFESY